MRHKGNIMERRVRLKAVNSHITCLLCKGYLIDATTITECLHTFCKSCLVKYLEEHNTCPRCELVIHQSHPLNYISHDRTMQDIVYKLVPNLQEGEKQKIIRFYKKRGLPVPSEVAAVEEKETEEEPSKDEDKDYHRSDEQVNICLECNPNAARQLKSLKRKYLRCSSHTTVTHLKKFLALKLFNNRDRFKDIEVLCNEEILGKDHTLKFVCVTRWRYQDIPLKLNFRPKMEF